jgi:predicted amidophosphoribosyltransferase
MFAQYFAGAGGATPQTREKDFSCPECQNTIPTDAKFCPYCGHQQLVIKQCAHCGKNLTANAKFCSRCGHPAEEKPQPKFCAKCGAENLHDSKFCGSCGEKISE